MPIEDSEGSDKMSIAKFHNAECKKETETGMTDHLPDDKNRSLRLDWDLGEFWHMQILKSISSLTGHFLKKYYPLSQ